MPRASRRHQPGADTAYSLSGTGVRINAVCRPDRNRNDKTIFDNAKQRGTDGKIGQLNPLKRAGSRMSWRRWDCSSPATRPLCQRQAIRSTAAHRSMPYAGKPI